MPHQDEQRLQALPGYQVLDTPAEQAYDNITELAARHFDAPIAFISLLDRERQCVKSRFGFDTQEIPRAAAFCHLAIGSKEVTVVPDARVDPRLANKPRASEEPDIRFYAGAPLLTPDRIALGAGCVADSKARVFDQTQRAALATFSRKVMVHLALGKTGTALSQAREELHASAIAFWRSAAASTPIRRA